MKWILVAALAAGAFLCGPCFADSCTALSSAKLSDTTITTAELVAAGSYLPKESFGVPRAANLAAHCRVTGFIHPTPDSHIGFEVWMPVAGWSGRYIQVGNGGLGGQIVDTDMITPLKAGAATASTDDGHISGAFGGFSGDWAIGHPEKVIDYGYRAVHLTAIVAQALVKSYYGRKEAHDYFVGCSDGGRESLMEAQRYPEDFEGYLVGAPGINIFNSFVSHLDAYKSLTALGPDHQLNLAQLKALSARVIQHCDVLDGVKDGVLRDPRACRFDPHEMICSAEQAADSCLTSAQADAVARIYDGPLDPSTGTHITWGANGTLGAEDRNWPSLVTGPTGGPSPLGAMFAPMLGALLYGDPARDVTTDLPKTLRDANSKLGPIINPDSPDLSRARALGRKIIMFHGWADPNIKPQESIAYFEAVDRRMGHVSDFLRFFMIPDMPHCDGAPNLGADYVGPTDSTQGPITQLTDASNNWHAALERWVEQGKAPQQMIATEFDFPDSASRADPVLPSANVKSTRPLCAYPARAVYKGKGPTSSATSFICKD